MASNKGRFIFPGWVFLAVAGVLVLYSLIATALAFDLLTLPTPGKSIVNHRLRECSILWTVTCSGIGWIKYLRRKRRLQGQAWLIILVPLLIGVWLAGATALDSYNLFVGPAAMPRWIFLMGVAIHFAMGGILAGGLWAQCKIWRRCNKPGICAVCKYDLTGNESGKCPECGTVIEDDPTIPAYFYSRRHRWLPELNQFETAKQRQLASLSAHRSMRRSVWWGVGVLLALSPVVCFFPRVSVWLGDKWAPAFGASVAFFIAFHWAVRRKTRALLRKELAKKDDSGSS